MTLNGDIHESTLSSEEKAKWQKLRWKNRRIMAYVSVVSLCAIVLLLFFAPVETERLKIIADPLAMIAFVFGGIVGAYMGFATIEQYKMKR